MILSCLGVLVSDGQTDRQTDRRTNEWTLVVVESLSRLKLENVVKTFIKKIRCFDLAKFKNNYKFVKNTSFILMKLTNQSTLK